MQLVKIDPVPINSSTAVHGLDLETREPVLSFDGGKSFWTLGHAERPYIEDGEERFTPDELKRIHAAVAELKEALPDA